MAFTPNRKKEPVATFSETNRFKLFYHEQTSDNAPTHNGYIVITADMIEEFEPDEDGVERFIIALTGWQKDSGYINGVAKSHSETQEKFEKAKAAKERKTPAKGKK